MRPGETLGLGEDVDVEMRGAARCGGDFAPRVFENPMDEFAGGAVVAPVAPHADCEEAEVLEKTEPLLAEWTPRAEEVAFDDAVLLEDERRLGLNIRVVGREVVSKNLAVLEYGVDRIAQKPGFAAQAADRLAVAGFIGADGNAFG